MKNDSMNQMNPMNLLQGSMTIKKFFFDLWVLDGCILGSFRYIWLFLGFFTLFSINKLLNISSLNVSNVLG